MKAFFKKNQIRFDGTKEIETKIKNQTDNVISRRFKILIVSVIVFGLISTIRQNLLNIIPMFLLLILLEVIFMIEI